jgi:hypothetical protein
MITIRYADLPEGLHAQARAHGRRTVIYLRPGLTTEQRRLSLRRARQSARMGYGPQLPGPGVALAVARHVSAGTLWNLGAAVRRHPIGFLVLSAGLVTLMASYVLFVTVSIRLMLAPAQLPPARGALPGWVMPASQAPRPGGAPLPGHAARTRPGSRGARDGPQASGERDRRARDRGPAGRVSPSPTPSLVPFSSPSPAATPPPSPAASPSPRSSVCVTVGPIGVCV